MQMQVLFHNNCFDGAYSAAVFTHLHRTVIGGATSYGYLGMAHRAGPAYTLEELSGDQNAVVDFKYTAVRPLDWWFDHHDSAFQTPELRSDFDARLLAGANYFFAPEAISCTGFILDVARERFGMDTSNLSDLRHWADIIDGARFSSPEQAVELREPAIQIAAVFEALRDTSLIRRLIPDLARLSFEEVVELPEMKPQVAERLARQKADVEMLREAVRNDGGLLTYDIAGTDGFSKFVPYYLHPDAVYTVGLTAAPTRTKISVGTNPWTTRKPETLANIADICIQFGGGGHPRVGAVTLDPGQADAGRVIMKQIIKMLRPTL